MRDNPTATVTVRGRLRRCTVSTLRAGGLERAVTCTLSSGPRVNCPSQRVSRVVNVVAGDARRGITTELGHALIVVRDSCAEHFLSAPGSTDRGKGVGRRAPHAGIVPARVYLRPGPTVDAVAPVPSHAGRACGLLGDPEDTVTVLLDLTDTIVEVHGWPRSPPSRPSRSSRAAVAQGLGRLRTGRGPPGKPMPWRWSGAATWPQAGAAAGRLRDLLRRPGGHLHQDRGARLDRRLAGPADKPHGDSWIRRAPAVQARLATPGAGRTGRQTEHRHDHTAVHQLLSRDGGGPPFSRDGHNERATLSTPVRSCRHLTCVAVMPETTVSR